MDRDSLPVLVGVDGSEESHAALQWAAGYAAGLGAPVRIVISWQYPVIDRPVSVAEEMDFRAIAAKIVGEMAAEEEKLFPGVKFTTEVLPGRPAEMLVHESSGARLLVIGSRGHGSFTGALIGSVSLHCVCHAHCPVVVVR